MPDQQNQPREILPPDVPESFHSLARGRKGDPPWEKREEHDPRPLCERSKLVRDYDQALQERFRYCKP